METKEVTMEDLLQKIDGKISDKVKDLINGKISTEKFEAFVQKIEKQLTDAEKKLLEMNEPKIVGGYNVEKQDALYQWSKKAVKHWM
jgi:predicted  nucleic acid-binding Zn-ribbon protein